MRSQPFNGHTRTLFFHIFSQFMVERHTIIQNTNQVIFQPIQEIVLAMRWVSRQLFVTNAGKSKIVLGEKNGNSPSNKSNKFIENANTVTFK